MRTAARGLKRLPFAPVLERTDGTILALAERVGASPRAVQRWKRGGVSVRRAEDVAGQLGLRPWGVRFSFAEVEILARVVE